MGSIGVAFPPGVSERLPGGRDNSSVGVVRLQKKYSEARAFLFCFGDETRQRA